MTVRIPALAAALALAASSLFLPVQAEAQRRAVVRRPVVVRPPVVVRARPTVFVGGYYYPSFYRPGLYYGYGGYYGAFYGGHYGSYYGGFGAPYYYQGPPYYGRYDLGGAVRTQVSPRETEVFIDGYFAGTVDDFDGVFQRLNIESGEHDIELYLPGHRPYQQRVYLQPGRTFSIRHTMEPLGPGEPVPARPAGAPLPPPGTRDPYASGPQRDPRGAGPDSRAPNPESRVPGPAAQGFGQLSLRVQPGDASVTIDGERWEGGLENERLVVQLGTGLHRIEIRRDGYRNYFTDVTIASGQTRALNVALTKE